LLEFTKVQRAQQSREMQFLFVV